MFIHVCGLELDQQSWLRVWKQSCEYKSEEFIWIIIKLEMAFHLVFRYRTVLVLDCLFSPKLKLFLHVLWLIIRLFDTYLAACSSQPKPVILVSLPLSPCWVVPWHISHLNLTAQLGACYISHFQCRPKYCLYVTYFAMLVPHTVANSFGYCCSSHHQHHPDLCLNMTYLSTPLPHGENMVIVWVISSAAVFCALAWPTCHTSTSTANSVIILQANVT